MNVSEIVKTQTVIVFNSPVFSKIASHMHHAFLYISLPFNLWTTTTWNCLILRVMEDVHKPRRNNISLPELGYCPLWNSTSGRFAHIWQSKWVGIIAIKTVGKKIHYVASGLEKPLLAGYPACHCVQSRPWILKTEKWKQPNISYLSENYSHERPNTCNWWVNRWNNLACLNLPKFSPINGIVFVFLYLPLIQVPSLPKFTTYYYVPKCDGRIIITLNLAWFWKLFAMAYTSVDDNIEEHELRI